MFSELIRRNSKRNRQENTLYFVTMILTVAAFYIILALDHQDVMIFLKEMERDAVNKLLMLIPILYVVSLCLLYFLVYFTDKYQMERRSHEFGTYVMLGMKKRSLFQMLFLEDLRNIVYALVIGIPGALLISELTSLITAKLAGFGILRHQFTFSGSAALWTVIGICGIKMLARFVLCIKLWKKEVYELLSREQKEKQRAFSPIKTCVKLMMGIILLAVAYGIGCGILSSELGIKRMFRMTAILCFCGVLGTILNLSQHFFRISDRQLQISTVKNLIICQIFSLIRTVSFQSIRLIANCLTSKSCPRTVGSRGIKRCTEQHDL